MKKFLPVAILAALVLTGCATPATPDDGRVHIVASTSVYGDLAAEVAGDRATVTSLISKPSVDPHSFEASARDQLSIADADLVIENGGGYDTFVDTLIAASRAAPKRINAVETSGLPGPNEHVWYSFDGVTRVVREIVKELSAIDSAHASEYAANGATLTASIASLQTRAEELAATSGTGDAVVTELVPVYLLQAAGLTNVTPPEFTEAVEEGGDVPPLALEKTLTLLKGARLLAYNSQTASPDTEKVRKAAEAAGLPVVDVTETLPEGSTYVEWMSANLDHLTTALAP